MTTPTTRTVAYRAHLRKVMSEAGRYNTTELVPLLADREVVMTSTQVYGSSPASPSASTCDSSPRCATSSAALPTT